MLATLRSLLLKQWTSVHEEAWSWMWENIARMLLNSLPLPPLYETALSDFLGSCDREKMFEMRKVTGCSALFFVSFARRLPPVRGLPDVTTFPAADAAVLLHLLSVFSPFLGVQVHKGALGAVGSPPLHRVSNTGWCDLGRVTVKARCQEVRACEGPCNAAMREPQSFFRDVSLDASGLRLMRRGYPHDQNSCCRI